MSAPQCAHCTRDAAWRVEIGAATGHACNQERHLSRLLEGFAWKGPRGMSFVVTDIRAQDLETES